MLTIAITGSKGFLGKNFIQFIHNKNFKIIELIKENNFDINDFETLKKIDKIDVIIHFAGQTFVPDSYNNSLNFYKSNIVSLINILELVKVHKAKLIFPSSYLYGQPEYSPIDENHKLAPHNPYSHTKYISEEIIKCYSKDFKINAFILRISNVYGPHQKKTFLIPEIISKLNNEKITLNDKTPKRDYIYIDDVCDVFSQLVFKEPRGVEIYNLGTGKTTSVEEILNKIIELSNKNIEVEYLNKSRENELIDPLTSSEKLYSLLNWKPQISLDEGLKKTIDFYVNQI